MRYSWLPLLLCLLLFCTVLNAQPHLDTAKIYVGITELTGNNDGAEIEKFQKYTSIPKGASWCAAFVSYCIGVNNVLLPNKKTGLAQGFITKRSIKANDVLLGLVKIPPGSIFIYKNGNTWKGHTGFVLDEWEGKFGKTIEGNTSPSKKGNQRNGDGCYIKNRGIYPSRYFRITHFTLVKYLEPIKIAGYEFIPGSFKNFSLRKLYE